MLALVRLHSDTFLGCLPLFAYVLSGIVRIRDSVPRQMESCFYRPPENIVMN